MKIQMQYPNISGNQLCDGRVHIINPSSLNRIEDFDLYLLDYFDETFGCYCTTVLIKTKTGFKKIPLLDYDLLFRMLENNQLNLIPVDLMEIILNNRNLFINAETPKKDISVPLTQTRACIIIYIGKDGSLYTKINGKVERINAEQLSAIMQKYDIEWRYLENNMKASPDAINRSINRHLGHQPGLSVKERYNFGDIRHYTVSFEYTDSRGFRRSNSSV